MKTIFLLRHAAAVNAGERAKRDFDRELNGRGREEAARIGKFMAERSIAPQLILCSPSRRTRETIELAMQQAGSQSEMIFDERIYEASINDLLKILASIDDHVNEVLLVGHNPGIEELLVYLTNEIRPTPPATFAKMSCEIQSWSEIEVNGAHLEWLVTPRDLPLLKTSKIIT